MIDVVAGVLWNKNKRILVAQKNKSPWEWEFPGGKVEPGENRENALRREIFEELGCNLQTPVLLVSQDHISKPIRLHFYSANLLPPYKPQEHRAIRWVDGNSQNLLEDLCPSDSAFWEKHRKNLRFPKKK